MHEADEAALFVIAETNESICRPSMRGVWHVESVPAYIYVREKKAPACGMALLAVHGCARELEASASLALSLVLCFHDRDIAALGLYGDHQEL
jgi:hypothetical protein